MHISYTQSDPLRRRFACTQKCVKNVFSLFFPQKTVFSHIVTMCKYWYLVELCHAIKSLEKAITWDLLRPKL